jgi:hypothetical protein
MASAQRPGAELRRPDRSGRHSSDSCLQNRADLRAAVRRQLQRRVGPQPDQVSDLAQWF